MTNSSPRLEGTSEQNEDAIVIFVSTQETIFPRILFQYLILSRCLSFIGRHVPGNLI
jgi:hypothetical protein